MDKRIFGKDCWVAAVTGFFTGLFATATIWFSGVKIPNLVLFSIILIAASPVWWVIVISVGQILGRKFHPVIAQLTKFSAVGFMSSSIDFITLNFLSWLTGVTEGIIIGPINMPGFILATINAYLWDRKWVFKSERRGTRELSKEMIGFFTVAGFGILINSAIVYLMTTYVGPDNFSPTVWLNISKIVATSVATFFNFVGYKMLVFPDIPETDGQAVK